MRPLKVVVGAHMMKSSESVNLQSVAPGSAALAPRPLSVSFLIRNSGICEIERKFLTANITVKLTRLGCTRVCFSCTPVQYPWSAAPSLCIPPSASAPHQQVAQHVHCVEQGSNQYSQDGPSLHILPLHQQRKLGRHPRLKHNLLLDTSPSYPWTSWRLRHQKRGIPHQDGSQQLKSCHSFQQLQVNASKL